MFWEGLSPYNLEYAQAHQIYFLYSPVFSVIFAPIFFLPWWLGPYVWNVGNYTLFSLAIKWLPKQFDKYKALHLRVLAVGHLADGVLLSA